MKHYIEIAKRYFQLVEGLQLYPSARSILFWVWITTTGMWLAALVQFVAIGQIPHYASPYVSIVVPELIWVVVSIQVSAWKEKQLIGVTNRIYGTSYRSSFECRLHVLRTVMAVSPSEFLKVANEIKDLVSLRQVFRKHSDLTLSEFGRVIYDKDSKARLLALLIALFSVTVALAIKSDATLETIFEVYSQPGGQQFLLMVTFLVVAAFLAFLGLRIFVLEIIDVLAAWAIKLSKGAIFSDWLIAYLVRDLVAFHGGVIKTSRQLRKL